MGCGDYWDGFDEGVDAALVRRPHAAAIERVARQVQRWFPGVDIHLEGRQRSRGGPGPQRRSAVTLPPLSRTPLRLMPSDVFDALDD